MNSIVRSHDAIIFLEDGVRVLPYPLSLLCRKPLVIFQYSRKLDTIAHMDFCHVIWAELCEGGAPQSVSDGAMRCHTMAM